MLRLALHRPGNGRTVIVLVVQDNLVKGASGQAVQCMNLMFGLAENTGPDPDRAVAIIKGCAIGDTLLVKVSFVGGAAAGRGGVRNHADTRG
jgi:hypothetical protein